MPDSIRAIRRALLLFSLILLLLCYAGWLPRAHARQPPAPPAADDEAGPQPFDPASAKFAADMAGEAAPAPAVAEQPKLTLIDLYWAGGALMHPILFMSLLALTFGIERTLALRRGRVIPAGLIDGLGLLAASPSGLDPRKAYRLCQQFPSAASTVIRAMLLKIGRPHSEVEHAVSSASDNEATRLYGNVRWISLAVQVSPLLGLLGTVQGMIMAFYDTAYAPVGVNKATHLARGIYVALITTFGGLCVAIPAAILVHYLEGRILRLFREVDELTQSLLPQVERYEGKLRVSHEQLGNEAEAAPSGKPSSAAVSGKTSIATPGPTSSSSSRKAGERDPGAR